MDFTDAFRISRNGTQHCAEYSPGSRFLATLHHIPADPQTRKPVHRATHLSSSSSSASSSKTTAKGPRDGLSDQSTLVQVRSSATMQVVRTWTLPFTAQSTQWSDDGTMLLLVGSDRFVVLSIESRSYKMRAKPRDCVDENVQDCILNVVAGAEGMHRRHGAQWIASRAVCCFSADTLLATIYDIRSGVITVHPWPKVARVYTSPSSRFFALLSRQESVDKVAIYSLADGRDGLHLLECFPTRTNDAAGLVWSPDERFLCVWEGILEYKLQVISTFGYLQASFSIEATDPNTTLSKHADQAHAQHAAGGLGIREVKWSPSGKWISVGDYCDHVRVLETSEWSQCADFDAGELVTMHLSEKFITSNAAGWREPLQWQTQTGGRSIVEFDALQLPIALPRMQGDLSSPNPQTGICWMEWNGRGDTLAVRCESVPSALYIFSTSEADATYGLRLSSVVVFSSPISHASWRPSSRLREIAVVCRTQAVYVWNMRADGEQNGQVAEAVPIPIDNFAALHIAYSPDGQTLLIMSDCETFCCAMEASDNTTLEHRATEERQPFGRL